MNRNFYSNSEFEDIKKQLNAEIKRRGTFTWWDPLVTPKVGQDRTPPITIPDGKEVLSDETYTINNPSDGSIEPTRNTQFPAHGDNPAGGPRNIRDTNPNTSAARWDVDEAKNFIVGLAKIQDINLFYGRDEVTGTAFRDPQGIEDALIAAQQSELNRPLHETNLPTSREDPNGGMSNQRHPDYGNVKEQYAPYPEKVKMNPDNLKYSGGEITAKIQYGYEYKEEYLVPYQMEDGIYVMPSGEYDGEEVTDKRGPSKDNFFDDYGAPITDTGELTPDGQPILISDSNYHPINPHVSPVVDRSWNDQQNSREDKPTKREEGGVPSARFGPNPRNPQRGNQYRSRPVFGGVIGSCNVACTGLCYTTCDNECSESCTTTCWSRCGNACTSTCGNVCTGCNTLCYTSCKTKCENLSGYACLNAGARTVNITSYGSSRGSSGTPDGKGWPRNAISSTTYTCNGCAYTCQFYPNKRTTCWDAACQELCFTTCRTYCSNTCFGGCIDNAAEGDGDWKTGIGRGCSSNCTVNCIGTCHETCHGECTETCFHACMQLCYDNCAWQCHTNCGAGCSNYCTNGCTGCDSTCDGYCKDQASAAGCTGCGWEAGCTSTCRHDCNTNCIGIGCRSVCGIDNAGSCEANCRISCSSFGCSSLCGQACSSQCTTCVNNCGIQCGPCSSQCSVGCGADCNITCSERCSHSCETNCTTSCSEECGGCSSLCYSCVGMCIGVCSTKCENVCTACSNNCGWWCDTQCGRGCFSNCSNLCINSCSGSCSTFLTSNTSSSLLGPERPPTAEGYHTPNPKNREEEQESFMIDAFTKKVIPPTPVEPYEPDVNVSIDRYGNIVVVVKDGLEYTIMSSTSIGGTYKVDEEGKIIVDEEMLGSMIEEMHPNINVDGTDTIFMILIYNNPEIPLTSEQIHIARPPFGLEFHGPLQDEDGNTIILITKIDWNLRVDDPLRLK